MIITKKQIFYIIALLWLVFSLAYIFYDVWSDFKLKELNQAYQQGKADTINALIQQSKNCQTVSISSGTEQIQVIDTSCLKTSGTTQ